MLFSGHEEHQVSVSAVDQVPIPVSGLNFSEPEKFRTGSSNVSDPDDAGPNSFFSFPNFLRNFFPVLRFRRSDEAGDLADRRKLDSREERLLESREEQVRGDFRGLIL